METADDPFVSPAFLGLAEAAGAAGEDLAWRPMHCVLRDEAARIEGFLPLYLRHHSFGDFSHDWQWAAAWRQAGLAYYPMFSGVPYTPSPGPRLLSRRPADAAIAANLVQIAIELARETGASAWQCLMRARGMSNPCARRGSSCGAGCSFTG